MTEESLFAELKARFGDTVIELVKTASPYIALKPSGIHDVALFLRDEKKFDSLMCLSGLDTMNQKMTTKPVAPGGKPEPAPLEFAVVYHLGSVSTRAKIGLRVSLDRNAPSVPTISDVWGIANWHEREAFDMFGIRFEGHPEMTRILCPDDWEGHPLRKDYVMPKSYAGIEHARRPSGAELWEKERAGR